MSEARAPRSRVWPVRIALAVVGLGSGTILGLVAAAAREGLDVLPLGPEHALGLGVGVVVALWIAADL